MKVLIGLSGGVDSSVAAYILKEKGYEVIGATMSLWGKDNTSSGHKNACFGPDEIQNIKEAEKLAKKLDIPYYVIDCRKQFEETVLKNFKDEYISGRTPNPCVWCNSYVKFGALPDGARMAGISFDKFATGHYALVEEKDGQYLLKKGCDPKKDQSYFLYRLTQEKLKNLILPLGGYTKNEIREIAAKNGFEAAKRPDSQDFYGGEYNELLNLEEKEGNIVDIKGNILGRHKGIWNYTTGQRRGIKIAANKPLYVLSLNKERNEVVVGDINLTFKNSLKAKNVNWICRPEKDKGIEVEAKIRSAQKPFGAILNILSDDEIEVIFKEPQKSVAIGQSVVLYDKDYVLGGAIIESSN